MAYLYLQRDENSTEAMPVCMTFANSLADLPYSPGVADTAEGGAQALHHRAVG